MRKIQTIVACAFALAVVGVATLKSAENDSLQGKATVRRVQGNVQYQASGGEWMAVKVNQELDPGVMVRTGPDSIADISVNGLASAVRLNADTTMAIPTMGRTSTSRDADTDTMLDLQNGSILGNVKKISANSRYDIKTPHGVAGIRGTDFQVTVVQQPDGRFRVTFTSITGQVIVSAVVTPGGPAVVKVLRDGESWTPGEDDVHPTPLYLLNQFRSGESELSAGVYQLTLTPGAPPTVQPFPTGGQSSGSHSE